MFSLKAFFWKSEKGKSSVFARTLLHLSASLSYPELKILCVRLDASQNLGKLVHLQLTISGYARKRFFLDRPDRFRLSRPFLVSGVWFPSADERAMSHAAERKPGKRLVPISYGR